MELPVINRAEDFPADGQDFLCKTSDAIYFGNEGIGHSSLCKYKDSPAHYKAHIESPPKDLPQFVIGRAIHACVLEHEVFKEKYVVGPSISKATKKYKEWLTTVPPNQDVIDQGLWNTAHAMRTKILFDNELSQYITGGYAEVAAFCTDPTTKVKIKAKFDYYLPELNLIVDLKTTSKKINTRAFEYGFTDYNYIVQAAFYTHVAKVITGRNHHFAFLFIETAPPHEAVINFPDNPTFDLGHKKWRRYLETHRQCIAADDWPGYPDKIRQYHAPTWAFTEEGIT